MSHAQIGAVTLVVPDYDDAITFYVNVLGFELVSDTDMGAGKRWVLVRPRSRSGSTPGTSLLLAKAADEAQCAAVGRQAGGRVGFFLHTDDFASLHARFLAGGVTFEEEPRHEAYGTVAVFQDPFGNRWDLLQLA